MGIFNSDSKKAEKYYKKASRLNDEKAIEYYIKASGMGHVPSMMYLADYYIKKGTDDFLNVGLQYYEKAAYSGSSEAIFFLAEFYSLHIEVYSKKNAMDWSIYALNKGDKSYVSSLAEFLYTQHDPDCVICLESLALQSDLNSCLKLAKMYEIGDVVDKSDIKSFHWYVKSAELGDYQSVIRVANCYQYGIGTTQNIPSAIDWYTRAASFYDGHYSECLYNIGHLLLNFDSTHPKSDAISFLEQSAELGNVKALLELGEMYVKKSGSVTKGIDYLKKAATGGSGSAAMQVAEYYQSQNNSDAIRFYKIVANGDDPELCYRVSVLFLNKVDHFDLAYLSASRGYELGNVDCLLPLGVCFLYGKGVVADYSLAFSYIKKAIELNNPDAFVYLGNFYFRGIIVEQSYDNAFSYYSQALSKGSVIANMYLGICYLGGYGTDKSKEKSISFFEKYVDSPDARFYYDWIVAKSGGVRSSFGKPYFGYNDPVSEYYDEPITYYYRSHAWSSSYDKVLLLKSAELGCPEAHHVLGLMEYKNGENFHRILDIASDPEFNSIRGAVEDAVWDTLRDSSAIALKHLKFSAEHGHPESYGNMGQIYLMKQDYNQALSCFDLCFESSDSHDSVGLLLLIPFYQIADMFYFGKTVSKSYDTAVKWAIRGHNLGDIGSSYILGLCYYYGNGIKQSYEESRYCFESILSSSYKNYASWKHYECHKGEDKAIYGSFHHLGMMYYYGFGVEKSLVEAASYFVNSSEHFSESKMLLSKCITDGNLFLEGEYKEDLKTGGTLVINEKEWFIRYYIPGPNRKTAPVPDLRYKGSYYYVRDKMIEQYISAWKSNYETYSSLIANNYSEPQSVTGVQNMIITVSRNGGVYLCKNSPLRVLSKEQLDCVISDYEYSKQRAIYVRSRIIHKSDVVIN